MTGPAFPKMSIVTSSIHSFPPAKPDEALGSGFQNAGESW
jgi:hypothetical protein